MMPLALTLACAALVAGAPDAQPFAQPVNTARTRWSQNAAANDLIRRNGFAVLDQPQETNLYSGYYQLYLSGAPVYVTTDAMLYVWYETLRTVMESVEETRLAPLLTASVRHLREANTELLRSAQEAELRGAAQRNAVLLEVAARLLSLPPDRTPGTDADASELLARIREHRQAGGYPDEDFTQYTVRGHYTHNETLSSYFLASMWLQRQILPLTSADDRPVSRDQILRAVALAHLLSVSAEASDVMGELERAWKFFSGQADAISLVELHRAATNAWGAAWHPRLALDATKRRALQQELSSDAYPTTAVRIHLTDTGTDYPTRAVAVLAQGALPDSVLFGETTFPAVPGRTLPDSLEVASALGSDLALAQLRQQAPTAVAEATLRWREKIRASTATNEGTAPGLSLYALWLRTLSNLHEEDERRPAYMKTDSHRWLRVNTSLASWAQMRHSFLLYGAQTYTVICCSAAGRGFVEPVPEVYAGIAEMCATTRRALQPPDSPAGILWQHVDRLERQARQFERFAELELEGKPLPRDGADVQDFASFLRPAPLDSPLIVADVATDGTTGRVLHAASGPFLPIAVMPDAQSGKLFFGYVQSFYQLTRSRLQRMTDKEWRVTFDAGEREEPPAWTDQFLAVTPTASRPQEIVDLRRCLCRADFARALTAAKAHLAASTEANAAEPILASLDAVARSPLIAGERVAFRRFQEELLTFLPQPTTDDGKKAFARLAAAVEHGRRLRRREQEASERHAASLAAAERMGAAGAATEAEVLRLKLRVLLSRVLSNAQWFGEEGNRALDEARALAAGTPYAPLPELLSLVGYSEATSQVKWTRRIAPLRAFGAAHRGSRLAAYADATAATLLARAGGPEDAWALLAPYLDGGELPAEPCPEAVALLEECSSQGRRLTSNFGVLPEPVGTARNLRYELCVSAFASGDPAETRRRAELLREANVSDGRLDGLLAFIRHFQSDPALGAWGKESGNDDARQPEAFVALADAHPQSPLAPFALSVAATAYERDGDPDASLRCWRQLETRYPKHYLASKAKGKRLLAGGQLKAAVSAFRAAAEAAQALPDEVREALSGCGIPVLTSREPEVLEQVLKLAVKLRAVLGPLADESAERDLSVATGSAGVTNAIRALRQRHPDKAVEIALACHPIAPWAADLVSAARQQPDHPLAEEAWAKLMGRAGSLGAQSLEAVLQILSREQGSPHFTAAVERLIEMQQKIAEWHDRRVLESLREVTQDYSSGPAADPGRLLMATAKAESDPSTARRLAGQAAASQVPAIAAAAKELLSDLSRVVTPAGTDTEKTAILAGHTRVTRGHLGFAPDWTGTVGNWLASGRYGWNPIVPRLPLCDDGTVIVRGSQTVAAYAPTAPLPMWSTCVGSTTSLQRRGDVLAVGCGDGRAVLLNVSDGAVLHETQVAAGQETSAKLLDAPAGAALLVARAGQRLAGLRWADGTLAWAHELPWDCTEPIQVHNTLAYLYRDAGGAVHVQGLDARTGAPVWERVLEGSPAESDTDRYRAESSLRWLHRWPDESVALYSGQRRGRARLRLLDCSDGSDQSTDPCPDLAKENAPELDHETGLYWRRSDSSEYPAVVVLPHGEAAQMRQITLPADATVIGVARGWIWLSSFKGLSTTGERIVLPRPMLAAGQPVRAVSDERYVVLVTNDNWLLWYRLP